MRVAGLLPTLLCALATATASAADLRTALLKLDFVPGGQDQRCIAPVYKAEIVAGRLSIRAMTDQEAQAAPTNLTRRSFEGRKLRYQAEDNGEWGGKLEMVRPTGERRTILEDNVQSMLKVGDDLYVFAGLAHLSMDTGTVYAVRQFDVEPKLERVTLLADTPVYATLVLRPREWRWFWIVGRSSLTELNEDLSVLKVHPFGNVDVLDFGGFAEVQERGLVIGTCGGVVAFVPPPHCRTFASEGQFDPCKPQFYVPRRNRK